MQTLTNDVVFALMLVTTWVQPSGGCGQRDPNLASRQDRLRHARADDAPALQTVVNSQAQQISQMAAQLSALQAKLNSLQTNVAFHARNSQDPFSVASHGTLVFDIATLNLGNAYDTRTGMFSTPVSGTYTFSVSCMASDAGSAEETWIVVEGSIIAGCYSSLAGPTLEQASATVNVHLRSGQRVWVKLLQEAEKVRGGMWNTFSGHLIMADAS